MDYLDFDLEITRRRKGAYTAKVVDSPAGQAEAEFKRPFSDLELENFVLKIGRTRTGVRRINSPEMQAAEDFGRKLFDAVFRNGVRECLTSCLHQINRDEIPGLRLKLRLVNVPELANLPWEFLYHPTLRRFISISTQTPLVRYTDLPRPVKSLTVDPPLRLLVVAPDPTDYPRLNVAGEKSKMAEALHDLETRGLMAVEWLSKATLSALQQRLRKSDQPIHLLHFIGHGGWDEQAQDGLLVFEDDHGDGRRIPADYLATLLHDHRSLRLAVLNACEGARSSTTDPFAGVAGTLVHQGIPAVLAMQFEITDRAAITLSQEFYQSLAEGYSAEAALAEARKAIFASGNDVEWGTPVLYLHAADGLLFNLRRGQAAVDAKEAEREEREQLAREKAEAERIAREQAEQARLAFEKAEAERLAKQQAEAVRIDRERAEAKRLAKEKEEEERIAREKADSTRFAEVGAEKTISISRWQGLRTLTGHKGGVYSVVFSPDGKIIVSGGEDATVKLWDVETGELLKALTGHQINVSSVAFSPDGKIVASGSTNNAVKLWDVTSGQLLRTLHHTYDVNSVAFSPNGTVLASGCGPLLWLGPADRSVKLWEVSSGQLLRTLTGHTGSVKSVVFSPDGKVLAAGDQDRSVMLWDASNGQLLRTLKGHTNWVSNVAFSPDGKVLASGSLDGTVKLWDVGNGQLLQSLKNPNSAPSVVFSPDGTVLASGGLFEVKLWEVRSGQVWQVLQALSGGGSRVNSVAFSPDGRLLASGSRDGTIWLWGVGD